LTCLNETEIEDIKNNKFVCQDCIHNQIRHSNLKMNEKKSKVRIDTKKKQFDSSTPKPGYTKSNRNYHNKINHIDSDTSSATSIFNSTRNSSSSSESENDSKLLKKYKKLKKLLKQKNDSHKSKESKYSSSDSDITDDDANNLSQSEAMIGIYRLTKQDRDKSKYEKLPMVDNVDTKWLVFYDLFKQSRKMFSHIGRQ